MTTKRFISAAILPLALLASFAPSALAAGTCFCNVEGQGATERGSTNDGAACNTLCSGTAKSQGYLWATDPSQYPSSLLQCFSSEDLCKKDMDDDGVNDGKWDTKYQPPECLPGWRYCYPTDSKSYTLQVSIPGENGSATTSVTNYGDYVAAMYKYLLGFAATVATVFLMVGGIRYVVGATTGEIGKAKEMIVKAITGLVLLLFSYVILYTVNPQMLKLEVPKLPMLRRVDILTGNEDCDSLIANGYDVDWANSSEGAYGTQYCGSVAEVLAKPDGTQLSGVTCMYTDCNGQSESGYKGTPVCVGNGTTARCLTCNQVVPGNAYNATPSAGVCSGLDPKEKYVNLVDANPKIDMYYSCGYSHSPSLVSSNAAAVAAVLATLVPGAGPYVGGGYTAVVAQDAIKGTCAAMDFSCGSITSCESYNRQQVYNTITDQELYDLYPSLGSPNLRDVCAQDPCGVGKNIGKTCTWEEQTGGDNCAAK